MWDRIFDNLFGWGANEPPYGPNNMPTGSPAKVRLVPRTAPDIAGPQTKTLIVGEQHTPEGERAYAQFNGIVARAALLHERKTLMDEQRRLLVGMAGWYFDADMIQRRDRAVRINQRVCEIDRLLERMQ